MENKWIFLPEVPDNDREVLVASKYGDRPVQAYLSLSVKRAWCGSREVRDSMRDGFVSDSELTGTEFIYAWRELPKMPPLPEDMGVPDGHTWESWHDIESNDP